MKRSVGRRVETLDFEDGTSDVVQTTKQGPATYSVSMAGDAKAIDGINFYNELATGVWGTEKVYLANPVEFETNLFPPSWASPGLCELGWIPPVLSATALTYADTPAAAASFRQPRRKATALMTGPAAETPTTNTKIPYVIIPIPPGYTLWLGVSGAATAGGPRVAVETWANGGAAPLATSYLTFLDESSATRLNASFAGTIGGTAYVRIFFNKSGTADATLTLTSMMAQIVLTGTAAAPGATGQHQPGQGNLGLKFMDDAIVETYPHARRRGVSVTLREVAR